MIIAKPLNGLLFALCAAALPATVQPALSQPASQPGAAQPLIPDPDAANAPIPDRETANIPAKQSRPAPQLAEVGVKPTNYPIPADALFASPNGDANAAGLDRNRPTTLLHALEAAPAEATIVLRGGDYRGIDGVKVARAVTMQPMPGETAWIKGSTVVTGFAPDGGQWSVAWDKKLTHPNANDLDKNNPIAGDTDMVFIAGRSQKQVATREEVGPGTFCVDTTAKKLVLGNDPTGQMVEATVAVKGFDIKGKEVAGTVIRGLGFAHFAESSMEAFASKLTFENNTFAWNAVRGMVLHDADHVMRGNTFACNGLSGMSGVYTDRLLFENNRVMFNNIEGFRATWSAAGTKFVISHDMTFRNNLYENNQAAALWFDISTIGATVIGNTLRSNKGLGIFYELSHGGLVVFNTVQDNGVGLMLSDASGMRVWNNTFLDNSKAVVVKDTPRVNDPTKDEGFYSDKQKAEDIAAGATWIAANNEFHNNLFAGGRGKGSVLFEANPPAKGNTSSDMVAALNHNAYAQTGDNPARVLVRWNSGGKPTDFESLQEFRAANAAYEAQAVQVKALPSASLDELFLTPNGPLLSAGAALPPDVKAAALAAGIKLPADGVPVGAMRSAQ